MLYLGRARWTEKGSRRKAGVGVGAGSTSDSKVEVIWEMPGEQEDGTYRLGHRGFHKTLLRYRPLIRFLPRFLVVLGAVLLTFKII